ncbi:hypothetical protein [Sphingobacterium lactis]|uniref:hypothetical protein n=1 Tax=Sphingobacterium lactis TaxID=797291 RepID=UPI003DA5F116
MKFKSILSVLLLSPIALLAQNQDELQTLKKQVTDLSAQVTTLSQQVVTLQDKIPYYEATLNLKQSEPVQRKTKYEVRITEVKYDETGRMLTVKGLVKKLPTADKDDRLSFFEEHLLTPEGLKVNAEMVTNGNNSFVVPDPEIDMDYAFVMPFQMAQKPEKLALLKFKVGIGFVNSFEVFSFKGLTVN